MTDQKQLETVFTFTCSRCCLRKLSSLTLPHKLFVFQHSCHYSYPPRGSVRKTQGASWCHTQAPFQIRNRLLELSTCITEKLWVIYKQQHAVNLVERNTRRQKRLAVTASLRLSLPQNKYVKSDPSLSFMQRVSRQPAQKPSTLLLRQQSFSPKKIDPNPCTIGFVSFLAELVWKKTLKSRLNGSSEPCREILRLGRRV